MPAEYLIYLKKSSGKVTAVLDTFLALERARTVNAVGLASFTVPYNFIPTSLLAVDDIVEIWRSVEGGRFYLDGGTTWFVRAIQKTLSSDGFLGLTFTCVDAMDLLARKIVAYAAGASQADKTGPADDLIKDIVSENLAAGATDTARQLTPYLTIDPNLSLAPSVSKSFSRRNLLTVCQEIAKASTVAGTYLAFDMVRDFSKPAGWIFKTYTGQRGVDHRDSSRRPVILDPENFSIIELSRTYSWVELKNSVYAGGTGVAGARLIGTASDPASIGLSPFNLSEAFQDGINANSAGEVAIEAQNLLRNLRSKKTFSGRYADTPAIVYGRDFGWGDFISATVDRESLDYRLDADNIQVSGGLETVAVMLRSEIQ